MSVIADQCPNIIINVVDLNEERIKNWNNTDFEKLENTIHRLKVFLVILPFRRVTGIFLSYRLFRVLGQISESIKKTFDGFQ